MLHKSFEILETKADAQAGTFEATVAVFGNVDKGGDRIVPGAFDKTLEKWRASGDPIPIILSHSWDNPFHHVGVADPYDVTATTKGLHVKGVLDIKDNDVAKQVHRLMQRRSLKEFSFGYSIPKGGEKRAKDGANELLEIDLAEVGPTLKGMNPATELHAVKSALGVEDPRDAAELRKAMSMADRQDMATRMREMADMMAEDPMPMSESEMARRMRAMATEMAGPSKTVETLDEQAKRVAREVEQTLIPVVAEQPKVPAVDHGKELQEVKDLLAQTRDEVDALKKKAEVTGDERTRSVDPLRKQADTVALEVASGGESLPKPPKTVEPPPPDLIPLDELKRRMRDEMLGVLSGGTTDESV